MKSGEARETALSEAQLHGGARCVWSGVETGPDVGGEGPWGHVVNGPGSAGSTGQQSQGTLRCRMAVQA